MSDIFDFSQIKNKKNQKIKKKYIIYYSMVRSELLQKMSNLYPNVLRKDIERILNIIISEIIEALKRDEMVQIRGWGTMKIKIRKARLARNPKKFRNSSNSEKKAIKWKMSKTFFNQLNKNFTENKISDTY